MNNIRKSMRNLIVFLLVFAMTLGDGGLLSFAAIKTGAGPRIEQNKELFKEAEAEESEELLASYDYEELADYVAKKLVKRETSIDISSYNLSSAAEVSFYERMINTHAELFFVEYDDSSDVTFTQDSSGNYCISISPNYKSEYNERQSIDFEKYVKLILLGVDSSWSDVEKILYLHDYLITHCECVDYVENSEKSNAYSAIVQGKADCLGYSMAFLYLMEKIGVEAGVVSSASLDIAWNYVILDGKRYYVDVAMDDPDNKVEFYCGHKWLLNGKNKCATGHESIDWQDVDEKNLYEEATDNTKYDSFFWTDVESAIPYLDNKWYYVDADTPYVGNLVLKSFDLSSESNETVCTAGNKDQFW
ncbi:MAG: hypothetical protein K5931_04390, partial [Lachnospiraceae bacterium]|nr:hypothetical protein [Lachnospiraceae bacterium]